MPCNRRCWQRGVTLIELVITIAVGSVVVAFMAMFIVVPVTAYTAQTRRAQLVDDAESALRFLGRDMRDRKSTRLNSSHLVISYAVFCLKKKKTTFSHASRYHESDCHC